jgi:hypothetical protein
MTENLPATTPSADDRAPDKPSRESLVARVRRAAYRKFPLYFSDPDYQRNLTGWRKRDAKKNAETQPPEDECVDVRCMWTDEFYTPSHIDGLLSGFSALEWDKDDDGALSGNPAVWVRHLREQPRGGGWFNLGQINRPGKKRFFEMARTAPLPPSAEYALGKIYSLTSSITCVVIGFVLTDEASRRYDRALRQTYETYLEPHGRGHSIHDPSSQKQKAIEAARARLRAETADWFRKYLPGLFASGHLNDTFPTCEFLTLRRAEPFPHRGEGHPRPAEFLHLLDLYFDMDAWKSDDIAGLRFSMSSPRDRADRFHAVAAIAEGDLSEDKLRVYGGLNRPSVAYYFNEQIQALLSRWALLAMLSGYERHLNAVRDSATLRSGGRLAPLGLLQTLRTLILQSVDISAVATELKDFARQRGFFAHEVSAFKPCDARYYENKDVTLGEVLRAHIEGRVGWLERADRSVRDLLSQYGNILGAQENIRVQQQIGRLTIFIAVLTVAAVWLAAENSKHLTAAINWVSGFLGR